MDGLLLGEGRGWRAQVPSRPLPRGCSHLGPHAPQTWAHAPFQPQARAGAQGTTPEPPLPPPPLAPLGLWAAPLALPWRRPHKTTLLLGHSAEVGREEAW